MRGEIPPGSRTSSRWIRPAPIREMDIGERRATWLELFFDLCFVAAVAGLSADLHARPTAEGLLRFAGLFLPVWWAWMAYTWFATAWDNDDLVFRGAMLSAMLTVLALAATVSGVAEGDSAPFAITYAILQLPVVVLLARSLPVAGAARGMVRNYVIGDIVGALVWLASLFVAPPGRYWVWLVGMLVLLTTPVFAVRSYPGQPYDSGHIPERYGLFTIIVLGESLVAVSAGLAQVDLNGRAAVTGALGFAIAACIWWLYFEFVRPTGLSRERLIAAFVWGYGHLVIYASIAAAAVAVELAIEAAAVGSELSDPARGVLCGAGAAFLLATTAIHAVGIRGWDGLLTKRLVAASLLALLGIGGGALSPIALVGAAAAVLLLDAAIETAAAGPEGAATD